MRNKKLLVVIIGIVILLGIFVFFSFLQKPKNSANSSNPLAVPTLSQQTPQNSTPYSAPLISFAKPIGTSLTQAPIAGGGSSVIVHLSDSTPTDIIEIQMTPSSITPIQQIYDIFTSFGMARSTLSVGPENISAVRFTGKAKYTPTPLQQDVVVFEKNGTVYKIQMMYSSDQVNSAYEQKLAQVLSNLQIP